LIVKVADVCEILLLLTRCCIQWFKLRAGLMIRCRSAQSRHLACM
jgi:hypothetical protein